MRPIHFQHYGNKPYFHTYCGMINFQGYREWPFTRTQKLVTCKLCLNRIAGDEQVVSYRSRLAQWAQRKGKHS